MIQNVYVCVCVCVCVEMIKQMEQNVNNRKSE